MRKEKEPCYDDIINLPHHVSKHHPQMPPLNRAAQFSPFAALTGHEAAIQEAARLTDSFTELSEDRKTQLDEQLQLIQENLARMPECEITYFRPDEKKNGGSYAAIHGRIKKIDEYNRQIIFTDGTVISIDYIFAIKQDPISLL